MRYEVVEGFRIKTGGGVIKLERGQTLALDTTKASKLVEAGKIKLLTDTVQQYEHTKHDLEIERYIGKPSLNPHGYKCIRCGAAGERYCLGLGSNDRFYWGWQCLRCRPFDDVERN